MQGRLFYGLTVMSLLDTSHVDQTPRLAELSVMWQGTAVVAVAIAVVAVATAVVMTAAVVTVMAILGTAVQSACWCSCWVSPPLASSCYALN